MLGNMTRGRCSCGAVFIGDDFDRMVRLGRPGSETEHRLGSCNGGHNVDWPVPEDFPKAEFQDEVDRNRLNAWLRQWREERARLVTAEAELKRLGR